MNDSKKLFHELNVHVLTLAPGIDEQKLARRLEDVLANYSIEIKSQIDMETDIEEKVMMFLSAKELEGASQATLSSYYYILRQFWNFTKKAATQVTTQDIRSFLASFNQNKRSTISTKLTTLNSFFEWLVREDMLLRSPTLKIKSPKVEKRNPKGLNIAELEKVRESCDTLRQRAMIEVFYSTGCRLSELRSLDRADINHQSMSAKVIGKGNKERVVYLSFKALYHLNKYLNSRTDECDALFVTQRRPFRRIANSSIQDEIDKVEKASGIDKKLTPHVLRHTFANLSMDSGIELADLQHLLGHSNPATTLVYTTVSEERKKQAFKKFHVQ